jgi:hypothetical protein
MREVILWLKMPQKTPILSLFSTKYHRYLHMSKKMSNFARFIARVRSDVPAGGDGSQASGV